MALYWVKVFTERDALFRVLAVGRDPASTPVADVMTKSPQTIHPDKPFVEALRMMLEGGFRNVPIVEDGRVLGMVSVRDALDPEVYEAKKDLLQREYDRSHTSSLPLWTTVPGPRPPQRDGLTSRAAQASASAA